VALPWINDDPSVRKLSVYGSYELFLFFLCCLRVDLPLFKV
jgi:hypothetical protein